MIIYDGETCLNLLQNLFEIVNLTRSFLVWSDLSFIRTWPLWATVETGFNDVIELESVEMCQYFRPAVF